MSEVEPAKGEETLLENEVAAGLVKSRDRERYWSTFFAPADKQPALLALYAFNAELDHIAAAAREPMVGQNPPAMVARRHRACGARHEDRQSDSRCSVRRDHGT